MQTPHIKIQVMNAFSREFLGVAIWKFCYTGMCLKFQFSLGCTHFIAGYREVPQSIWYPEAAVIT